MTRRTTVIQPSTTTDALYTLPNQPFKRRIVSASIYGFVKDQGELLQPELKIADVEGNVLFTATCFVADGPGSPLVFSMIWSANASDGFGFFTSGIYQNLSPGGVYCPSIIGENLCVPASNLLTITIYGSLPADTLPNLVLVTEDDDDDDNYRA